MTDSKKKIRLRDSTLREGMDTPGVLFSLEQRLQIASILQDAGIPEVEVVAPSRVAKDLDVARSIREKVPGLATSGLIYCQNAKGTEEILAATSTLHRFDLLMPVSEKRPPRSREQKISLMKELLGFALERHRDVGVGFPHAFQTDAKFLREIFSEAVMQGATRVTIYDTNGGADPFAVRELISRLRDESDVAIFFHGHNDLGLATANALAAILAGADGLDVTANGLGDRAGNASLEQAALLLHLRGFDTGIDLTRLRSMSKAIERESDVPVSKLAPAVGDFVVHHKSPSHLADPGLFEAFAPELVGAERKIEET
jgi:homocitrate synthase NifV